MTKAQMNKLMNNFNQLFIDYPADDPGFEKMIDIKRDLDHHLVEWKMNRLKESEFCRFVADTHLTLTADFIGKLKGGVIRSMRDAKNYFSSVRSVMESDFLSTLAEVADGLDDSEDYSDDDGDEIPF